MSARRRGVIIGAGLVGLAASPLAAPLRQAVRVRVERLRRRSPDPVAPFLEAPCYAPDQRHATRAGDP
jgi:hypothetical protein